MRALLLIAAGLAVAGCRGEPRGVAPVGPGPKFQQPSLNPAVAAGTPVGGLECGVAAEPHTYVHVELFARGNVVIVPAGLGIAPPRTEDGAYVRGGRCRYPLFTEEPTGVIAVGRDGLTLGDLFAVWGRRLEPDHMAGFDGDVEVHVDGGRWSADPADVPLDRHAQIVVQAGGPRVEPHANYRFPKGY